MQGGVAFSSVGLGPPCPLCTGTIKQSNIVADKAIKILIYKKILKWVWIVEVRGSSFKVRGSSK